MIVAALLFLVLSGLLLWAVVYGSGWWEFKLATILVVPAFMFAIWFALESFTGYPTTQTFPQRALFISGYYVDPDPQTHSKGAIYIWVILPKAHSVNPLDYNPNGDPRAYKLPYDEQTAEQVQRAMEAAKRGSQVEVRSKRKTTSHGKGSGGNVGGGRITTYVLPKTQAPAKH